jgi:hypothetical protein
LAKKQFLQYKEYADRLVAMEPEKDEWRMEVGYAVNNLGILAIEQGEAVEAEVAFRSYLDVTTALLHDEPNDVGRIIEVGQAYAWLSDALYGQFRIIEAKAARDAELAAYDGKGDITSENSVIEIASVIATYRLAALASAAGDPQLSLELSTKAAALADRLAAEDPENTERIARALYAHLVHGEANLHSNRYAEARRSLVIAMRMGERLIDKDETVAEWSGVALPDAKLALAQLEIQEGHANIADEIYAEVIRSLAPLIGDRGAGAKITRRYCTALAGRARLSMRQSEVWPEIVERLNAASKIQGPEGGALLAEAYERSGDTREAAAIVSRLHRGGYKHPDFLALLEEFPALKAAAIDSAAITKAQ